MKYIMFIQPDGQELPIIFPSGFEHAKVGRMMHSTYPGIKARSAASLNIVSDFNNPGKLEAVCFGKSISMNLKTHPEDRIIINSLINKKD